MFIYRLQARKKLPPVEQKHLSNWQRLAIRLKAMMTPTDINLMLTMLKYELEHKNRPQIKERLIGKITSVLRKQILRECEEYEREKIRALSN